MDSRIQVIRWAVMAASTTILSGAAPIAESRPVSGVDTGKICVVDMGSNTFKLILGEMSGGAYIERHVEKKTMQVGDDMSKTGRISDGKLKEIHEVLTEFKNRCESKGAVSVKAIATAAFREAENGSAVVEIGTRVEIPVEIASEERESTLAYLTATNGAEDRAVIDNGSRSIELVSKNANNAPVWKVVNLGYRTAYDQFFLSASTFAEAYEKMSSALGREYGDLQFAAGRQGLIGIELDEMATYLLRKKDVSGARIKLSDLRKHIAKLRGQTPEQFSVLKKAREIDRVLPRMIALEYILTKTGYRSVTVVSRELGVGLIIEAGLRH
jgi:exopolyphosphatase / guanosine-5'-triphosphate,3'-diphosphate pyrophosphatase